MGNRRVRYTHKGQSAKSRGTLYPSGPMERINVMMPKTLARALINIGRKADESRSDILRRLASRFVNEYITRYGDIPEYTVEVTEKQTDKTLVTKTTDWRLG